MRTSRRTQHPVAHFPLALARVAARWRRDILRTLVTIAGGAAPLGAQRATASQLTAFVDSVGEATVRRGRAAGLSITVMRGAEVIVSRGYGAADLENAVPVTPSSVFRIASLTKQFTAAAVLQLADRGRLSLDDDLARWLPDWPRYDRPVTIRMLLSHTSGIHDPHGPSARPARLDLARDVHDSVLAPTRADTLDFGPGTSYEYSNAGYHLLGLIIERASGQRYGDYLADHVFRPAGLTATSYCGAPTPAVPHRVRGYRVRDAAGAPVGFDDAAPLDMAGVYAAGALCSTAGDLVVWARALASGRVVSPSAYQAMTTPRTFALDRPQYGFGLALGSFAGHAVVQHGGSINGFTAHLSSYPADSVVVAILTNTETFAPDPLEHVIAARALGLPDPAPRDLRVTAADARALVGTYRSATYGITLRVSFAGGILTGVVPGLGRIRLRRQGDGRFADADDPYIAFQFAAGTPAAQVRIMDPAQTAVLTRVPDEVAPGRGAGAMAGSARVP